MFMTLSEAVKQQEKQLVDARKVAHQIKHMKAFSTLDDENLKEAIRSLFKILK
jgi:DNA-directed RNA polymerase subunit F